MYFFCCLYHFIRFFFNYFLFARESIGRQKVIQVSKKKNNKKMTRTGFSYNFGPYLVVTSLSLKRLVVFILWQLVIYVKVIFLRKFACLMPKVILSDKVINYHQLPLFIIITILNIDNVVAEYITNKLNPFFFNHLINLR